MSEAMERVSDRPRPYGHVEHGRSWAEGPEREGGTYRDAADPDLAPQQFNCVLG